MAEKQSALFKFLSTSWGASAENRKKKLEAAEAEANPTPKAPAVDTSDDSEYETTPEGTRRKRITF